MQLQENSTWGGSDGRLSWNAQTTITLFLLRDLSTFSHYFFSWAIGTFHGSSGFPRVENWKPKAFFFFFLTKSFLNVYVKNWSIILCGHGLHKSSSYGRLVHLERATFGDKLPQSATSGTLPLVSNSLSTFLGYFCNKDLRQYLSNII